MPTNKEINAKAAEIRQWFDECDIANPDHREALHRAARMIHSHQTAAEQDAGMTIEFNRRGFNAYDGDFGGRIARWHGEITLRMATGARKMLRKYAMQLACQCCQVHTGRNSPH